MEGQGAYMGSEPKTDIFVISSSSQGEAEAALLTHELRSLGLSADMDFVGRSIKSQMKAASQMGAKIACIIGEDEISSGTVSVKNMLTGVQETALRGEAGEKIKSWSGELS
jgi:histidyl-tRNA synthetase